MRAEANRRWDGWLPFVSNKGGVGKSTLSVNVACELARRYPDQVLLVDASLQLGVCSSLLDIEPEQTIVDVANEIRRLDSTLLRSVATVHECGVHLLPAPKDAMEAAVVTDEVMARIVAVARRSYRFVVVDTFPMLDSLVLALLDLSDELIVVLSGLVPTTLGACQFVRVLDHLGYGSKERRLVLCDSHPRFFGSLRRADVEERLGEGLACVVPFDKRVLTAANTGRPRILDAGRWSRFGRAVRAIADEIDPSRGKARVPAVSPREPEETPGRDAESAQVAATRGVREPLEQEAR